jgi:hypothetical protein
MFQMKMYLSILFFLSALFLIGCSNDSAPTGTGGGIGGGGTGGGGTGGVTVQVAAINGQDGPYFQFTPSVAVYMTEIVATCTALNINNESVTVNLTSGPTDPISVGPVQGMQAGQQWQFTIKGNITNAQGQAFSVNVNYTVQ